MANILVSLMPCFNGEKFDYWSNLMKLCHESQDLGKIVEEGVQPLKDEDQLTEAQRNVLKNKRQKDNNTFSKYIKQLKFQFMRGYLRQIMLNKHGNFL